MFGDQSMKKTLLSLFLIFAVSSLVFAAAKIKTKDLQILTGAQWTGNLIYLDYGTNKEVSIPSNLIVTQSKEDKLSWIFEYKYPDEPKADSKDTVIVSKDGSILDGEKVIERTELGNRTLKIVTEKTGTDNDKKSVFRFTYVIGKNEFSIKKEVKPENASEFFVRNEYKWKR